LLQAVSAHPQWFQVHTGNATTISLSKIMQDRMHHHNVMDPHMPKVLHHTMQDTLQRTQQALMAIVGILALEPNKAVSYKNLRHQVKWDAQFMPYFGNIKDFLAQFQQWFNLTTSHLRARNGLFDDVRTNVQPAEKNAGQLCGSFSGSEKSDSNEASDDKPQQVYYRCSKHGKKRQSIYLEMDPQTGEWVCAPGRECKHSARATAEAAAAEKAAEEKAAQERAVDEKAAEDDPLHWMELKGMQPGMGTGLFELSNYMPPPALVAPDSSRHKINGDDDDCGPKLNHVSLKHVQDNSVVFSPKGEGSRGMPGDGDLQHDLQRLAFEALATATLGSPDQLGWCSVHNKRRQMGFLRYNPIDGQWVCMGDNQCRLSQRQQQKQQQGVEENIPQQKASTPPAASPRSKPSPTTKAALPTPASTPNSAELASLPAVSPRAASPNSSFGSPGGPFGFAPSVPDLMPAPHALKRSSMKHGIHTSHLTFWSPQDSPTHDSNRVSPETYSEAEAEGPAFSGKMYTGIPGGPVPPYTAGGMWLQDKPAAAAPCAKADPWGTSPRLYATPSASPASTPASSPAACGLWLGTWA
jgi:hypothetical protein